MRLATLLHLAEAFLFFLLLFPPAAHAAYTEAAPLAPGHEERVGLWQLHPVLVHVCLFGGGYAAQARELAARYL